MGISGDMSTSNSYVKYHITVVENSVDVANNKSNVTVYVRFWRNNVGYETYGNGTTYCKVNGNQYSSSVTTSQKITNSGIDLFVQSFDINHNSDGSKTLETSAWINITSVLTSNEQYYYSELTRIPRASSISGGSGNIGSYTTFTINRASDSFTHTISYSFHNLSDTIATNMKTGVLWIIPTSFYAQIPNSNSSWGTVYCDTYSGGTWIGQTSNTFNVYVVNSNPTFSSSNISYQDTNSTAVAITGDNSKIVRNQSTLAVTFSAATAKNSASISSYQVTFNGSTQSYSSATTINYGTVNSGNNLNLTIKAIDSRGNSTSTTQTITFLDWSLPNAIITAARVNNFENDTNLKVDATISSVNSINVLQTLQYRYKKTSDTNFSDYVEIDNHTQYTISIDNTSAWDFQVLISDKFGSSTYNFIIAKGTPLMFFDTGKISVGINGFPVNDNSFEINGKTIFDMVYPIGAIFLSVNSTNPATYFGGTWVSWGTGRVPVGVDTNDSDFNTVEETGGSKYLQSHNHSTTASLDYTGNYSHNHGNRTDILAEGINDNRDGNYSTDSAVTIGNTGSGNSQNLQPYITCYMWKRTA